MVKSSMDICLDKMVWGTPKVRRCGNSSPLKRVTVPTLGQFYLWGPCGSMWPYGSIWAHKRPHRSIWDHMDPYGPMGPMGSGDRAAGWPRTVGREAVAAERESIFRYLNWEIGCTPFPFYLDKNKMI